MLAPLRRFVAKLTRPSAFARLGPAVVPRLDRLVHRVSGGRWMLAQPVVPSLMLVTTGRRTGQRRETPLACLPEADGSFLVVGSNFGRESHPAWSSNLLADPEATVHFRRRTVPVTAELLEGEARETAWAEVDTVWPNYADYEERSGRRLRVFRLHPVG